MLLLCVCANWLLCVFVCLALLASLVLIALLAWRAWLAWPCLAGLPCHALSCLALLGWLAPSVPVCISVCLSESVRLSLLPPRLLQTEVTDQFTGALPSLEVLKSEIEGPTRKRLPCCHPWRLTNGSSLPGPQHAGQSLVGCPAPRCVGRGPSKSRPTSSAHGSCPDFFQLLFRPLEKIETKGPVVIVSF